MTQKISDCQDFQHAVDQYLVRHRSILDILSKLHETSSRINRAVVKAVTDCGCISVQGQKQGPPCECSYTELINHISSQLNGELCESCREIIETELGHNLFYVTALCNTLGLQLDEVLCQEGKRLSTLRAFNLR